MIKQGVAVTIPVMITGEGLEIVGHALCAPTEVGATRLELRSGRTTNAATRRDRTGTNLSAQWTDRDQKGRVKYMKRQSR